MPQQNSSLFSSQSNGSQLHQELNQQTEPEQSTNNIKNHLILPLHSHLHLFHSFESQGLDITPNCKVTDHSHRRLHHLSPLTCCQLESHYRQTVQNCQHRATTNAMGLLDQVLGSHIQWKQEEEQKKPARLWLQVDSNSQVNTAVQEAPLWQKQRGQPASEKGVDSRMVQMTLLKLGRIGKPLQCLKPGIPAHSDFLFMLKELNETSCWQSVNDCVNGVWH